MFGLSVVKTAELQALQNTVAVLESDVVALNRKYNNLADQQQRSDTATREQLSALAKPKTCPVLEQTLKHVTGPVGAWERKQRVLEQRLAVATKDLQDAEQMTDYWLGRNLNFYWNWQHQRKRGQQCVHQLKTELSEHNKRKSLTLSDKAFVSLRGQLDKTNTSPSETAVFVRHKKYGTLGLLKGNHITILSKGNQLDVGDVILNATPAVVHEFWNIELRESVKLSV